MQKEPDVGTMHADKRIRKSFGCDIRLSKNENKMLTTFIWVTLKLKDADTADYWAGFPSTLVKQCA